MYNQPTAATAVGPRFCVGFPSVRPFHLTKKTTAGDSDGDDDGEDDGSDYNDSDDDIKVSFRARRTDFNSVRL